MSPGRPLRCRTDVGRMLRRGAKRQFPTGVGFGPKATHVVRTPVVLGGGHRRGHGRTPFRTQSARGLPRTILDDLSSPRRSSVSQGKQASAGGPADLVEQSAASEMTDSIPEVTIDGPRGT